jgi:GTPase SAR1 family protein
VTNQRKHIAIALIGQPGVGKTSIVHLIDETLESRGTTFVIETHDIIYTIWELQTSSSEPERLAVFSASFLDESKAYSRYVLIVSDSSVEDINQISYSMRFLRKQFPKTRFAIIANKQDLQERLNRTRIEKMTNLPTLELSATEKAQRDRLVNFISYLIAKRTGF